MNLYLARSLCFILGCTISVGCLAATEFLPSSKLIAADGVDTNYFGFSIAIEGNQMAIGAYGDSELGLYSGSVYVFEYNGSDWTQSAKLVAEDGSELDKFGTVAMDGNRLLVGASTDDLGDGSGSVYVFGFDGSNWVQQAKLLAADGNAGDGFGGELAISGNRMVIGASGDSDIANDAGSAYVFEYDGNEWIQTAKLLPDTSNANNRFGADVAIDGNRILVGADSIFRPQHGGSAYLFEYDGIHWVQTAELTPEDGGNRDSFGQSVSLEGDRLVVGSPLNGISGAAYVYTYDGNNWLLEAKLEPTFGPRDERIGVFGNEVELSGDRIIAGDYSKNDQQGAVYIFAREGNAWVQIDKLTSVATDAFDNFGSSIAMDGNRFAIGASVSYQEGYAYVYTEQDLVNPMADVRVNGFEGPLTLTNDGQEFTVTSQILSGDTTGIADWWLFADTPRGRYSYVHSLKEWVPGLLPTAQEPLSDVSKKAFEGTTTRLPLGTTVIQGGVDLNPNGVLDEPMFMDSMEVNIVTP